MKTTKLFTTLQLKNRMKKLYIGLEYYEPKFNVENNEITGTFQGMGSFCLFGASLFDRIKETKGEIITINSNDKIEMVVVWKI